MFLSKPYKFNNGNEEAKEPGESLDRTVQVLDVTNESNLSKLVEKYINDT
jgi:hypothetical protein